MQIYFNEHALPVRDPWFWRLTSWTAIILQLNCKSQRLEAATVGFVAFRDMNVGRMKMDLGIPCHHNSIPAEGAQLSNVLAAF
jgi:hypothetical protein